MAKTNILKFPAEEYYKEALESGSLTLNEMKSEYSRLRKIANQRLEALGRSEFADTSAYLGNVGKYVPLSEIESETELQYKLHDLARFVTAKSGSVTGQRAIRAQTIQTFQDIGVDFINARNYKRFTGFMEASRAAKLGRMLSSARVLELFGVLSRHRIDTKAVAEEFAQWEDSNLESKVDAIISAEINGAGARDIKNMIKDLS